MSTRQHSRTSGGLYGSEHKGTGIVRYPNRDRRSQERDLYNTEFSDHTRSSSKAAKSAGKKIKKVSKQMGETAMDAARDLSEGAKRAAHKTTEQGMEVLQEIGEKVATGLDDVGQKLSDSWITTKVISSLISDEAVESEKVMVTTHDGIVSLTGIVKDETERARVVDISASIRGVRAVLADQLTTPKPNTYSSW